jgi:hypothetical protein
MRHVCALHYYEYRGGAGFLMADLGLCIVVNDGYRFIILCTYVL